MIPAAGLALALAAILFHAPGYGYDEIRRPFVLLGAALVLAGGWKSRHSSGLLRLADLGLLLLAVAAMKAVNRTDAAAALFPAVVAWIVLRATALGWIPRLFLERHGLLLLSVTGILFSGMGLLWNPVSSLGNTNYSGVLSAVFSIAGFAAAFFGSGVRRLPGFAACVLGAFHVATSRSMAGLVGLAAGIVALAVLLVLRYGWKPVVIFPLVILVAAIAPAGKRVADRVATIARGEDRTSKVRLGLWRGTLKLAAAFPITGAGTGNFRMQFPPYRDAEERCLSHEGRIDAYVEAEDPHNTYLSVLSESGVLALIALLCLLGLAVSAGFRRARDPDPQAAALAFAGAAGLVTLAVSAFFNSLSAHLPFAVVAALLAGGISPVASQPVTGRVLAVVRIAFALLLALAPWPWFLADMHYSRAMHTSKASERLVHAQNAIAALPGHWQARFQIAVCWRAMNEGEGTVRAELRKILEIHPHCVAVLVGLASGAPPDEEKALLLHAQSLAPEFATVQLELVDVDLRERDYTSARSRLYRLLERKPDDAETLYRIGRTWLLERRLDEAVSWLNRAVALDPKLKARLGEGHPELRGDSRFNALVE